MHWYLRVNPKDALQERGVSGGRERGTRERERKKKKSKIQYNKTPLGDLRDCPDRHGKRGEKNLLSGLLLGSRVDSIVWGPTLIFAAVGKLTQRSSHLYYRWSKRCRKSMVSRSFWEMIDAVEPL